MKVAHAHQSDRLGKKGDTYYILNKVSHYVLVLACVALLSAGGEFIWVNREPTEVTDWLFNPGIGQLPQYSPLAAHQFLLLAFGIGAVGLTLKSIAFYKKRHLAD